MVYTFVVPTLLAAWFNQLARVVSEPLALSIMVVSVLACGLAMFTLIFLPDTKGKERQAFH